MPEKQDSPAGQGKEKSPKTKEMPLAHDRDYAEWVKKQKQPTLDDKGQAPPDPSEELKEPREHGSKAPTEGGKQS
jgi:hypothetical protein